MSSQTQRRRRRRRIKRRKVDTKLETPQVQNTEHLENAPEHKSVVFGKDVMSILVRKGNSKFETRLDKPVMRFQVTV